MIPELTTTEAWLPLVWGVIIAFGVFMYVLLDGFDLGIGILFPFAAGEDERDQMMASVAPIWDGNETWLVLGGAALLGAFPLAYSTLLSALYLPLSFMLLGLVLRGVAFEFRGHGEASRRIWSIGFAASSMLVAAMQGLVLGRFVLGLTIRDGDYTGGAFGWLTPFGLLCGLAVATGYALLGATWLVMKTEGPIQFVARRWARLLTVAILAFMGAVSLCMPFLDPRVSDRWFAWPNMAILSPVPVLVLAAVYGLWHSLAHNTERWPFLLALGLFLLGYVGLGISLWPNVVPPGVTLWDAASPPGSQLFLLVGTIVMIPIILAYTAYGYWVFRGKVKPGATYHH
jgi:cytochrome d ubiquinol oxidase subunit II